MKKYLFLLLSAFIFTSVLQPMHKLLEKNIPRFFKGYYWYLAAGSSVAGALKAGYHLYKFDPSEPMFDIDDLSQFEIAAGLNSLCLAVIKEVAPEINSRVKIAIDSEAGDIARSLPGVIILGSYHPMDIQNLIFSVGHEARHIANSSYDFYGGKVFIPFVMPFAVHATLSTTQVLFKKGIEKSMGRSINWKKPNNLWRLTFNNLVTKVPKGCAVSLISFTLSHLYNSWREKVADIQAGNALGPDVCMAAARQFIEFDRVEFAEYARIAKAQGQDKLESARRYSLENHTILYDMLYGRPPHLERATYLLQLAKKLLDKSD